jgi:hypothetical protein
MKKDRGGKIVACLRYIEVNLKTTRNKLKDCSNTLNAVV